MARILLKTTIPTTEDDWHIGRFSLLAACLADAGHDVTARDRDESDGQDTDFKAAAVGAYDQIWLFGVDVTGALTDADIAAIDRFRANGGGVMLSRDHQDLGACIARIPLIGETQHFQSSNPEREPDRCAPDDRGSPNISWPNYHSGCNGDAQSVNALLPLHPVMQRPDGSPIRTLPAHPHEGAISLPTGSDRARVVACGTSITTGRHFNIGVAIDIDGQGRAFADSSFHHFCDCNWDPAMGAPSFVDEPWGDDLVRDTESRRDAERYAKNIAGWLARSL